MVVVIAVILILVALVVPAATQMWNQRAIADAENAMSGLLMTARARALQGTSGETGLLFYVDDSGTQYVANIAKNPIDPDLAPPDPTAAPGTYDRRLLEWRTSPAWQDVFTIVGTPRAMPSSMRVLPRRMIEESLASDYPALLTNEDFGTAPMGNNHIDRHRNYFVLLYSTGGEPMDISPFAPRPGANTATRNVLIRDRDQDKNGIGDVTGLPVSGCADANDPAPEAASLYTALSPGMAQAFPTFYQYASGFVPPTLLLDPSNTTTALSFRTVDGLLVYDDELLREAGTDPAARRTALINTAQPFYINRLTGAVVKGPQGEFEAAP